MLWKRIKFRYKYKCMKKTASIFACMFMQIFFVFGQHTFSICAVDPFTGEVGSAGASCIGGVVLNVSIISDVHPGVGVVHTQANYLSGNQTLAAEYMNMGYSPQQIIDSVTMHDVGGDSTLRQYGVVDLIGGGRSAAFTGINCMDWKGHITGPTYSIQGNILLGPEILDSMEAKFLNTDGNLACKLMAALQGAKVPGADTRCFDEGVSAWSSFIRVADSTNLILDLIVDDVQGIGIDPIDSLQTLFDAIGGCDFVNIKNVSTINEVKVFPQPASGKVIFQLTNVWETLTVFDAKGNLIFVKNVTMQNAFEMQVNNWNKGIYFFNLLSNKGQYYSGKFIVQ